MKKSLVLGLALLPLVAGSVFAQSTGTVNVTGQVSKHAAVRWWSFTPIGSEIGANNPASQNGALDFSLDVDETVAGLNLQSYGGGRVQMILRSNAAFTLAAECATSSGFGVVANGDLALADVGFGIGGLTNSGAKVFGDPAAGTTVTAGFDDDPALAPKDIDEEPTFSQSLQALTGIGGVQLLSGPRISNRGGIGSPNNGLLVDTVYAIGPQFYTPVSSFTATVTYTLATP